MYNSSSSSYQAATNQSSQSYNVENAYFSRKKSSKEACRGTCQSTGVCTCS